MNLRIHPKIFSICKLPAHEPVPDWLSRQNFSSITRTTDELSIVCEINSVPSAVEKESGWRLISVVENLDFAMTGILSSISTPLAEAKISIFVISTFDTDYFLIKQENLQRAIAVLENADFKFV